MASIDPDGPDPLLRALDLDMAPLGVYPGCLSSSEFPGRCAATSPPTASWGRCLYDADHPGDQHRNIDGEVWAEARRRIIPLSFGVARRLAELRQESGS